MIPLLLTIAYSMTVGVTHLVLDSKGGGMGNVNSLERRISTAINRAQRDDIPLPVIEEVLQEAAQEVRYAHAERHDMAARPYEPDSNQ